MKALALLAFLFIFPSNQAIAQSQTLRVDSVGLFNKAVPGQIVDASVEGFGDSTFEANEVSFEFTQNLTKLKTSGRTLTTGYIPVKSGDTSPAPKMKPVQMIGFVVPKGLRPGEATIVVIYRKLRSLPSQLTILERPEPPLLTISMISLGDLVDSVSTNATGAEARWRLVRGTKTELGVLPLVDPNDPDSSILVRFKQREKVYQAVSRVVHQDAKVEEIAGGTMFLPSRDFLEVIVPGELEAGPAQVEVQVRLNGQTSDVATMPALITDVTGSGPSPADNAPLVNPRRVGAGQALMISGDRLLTLMPDPSRAEVMFEQDGVSYTVKPEMNSVEMGVSKSDSAHSFLIARPTRQLIGKVRVRVVNSQRSEQGGMSAATTIEVVDEVFPPELISVAESTTQELAQLRSMYETQRKAGREFAEYNPANRYLSIRAQGLEPKSEYVKITLEQDGRRVTLKNDDYSLSTGDLLIVRLPKGFDKGQVMLSAQNKGGDRFSSTATMKFELSR